MKGSHVLDLIIFHLCLHLRRNWLCVGMMCYLQTKPITSPTENIGFNVLDSMKSQYDIDVKTMFWKLLNKASSYNNKEQSGILRLCNWFFICIASRKVLVILVWGDLKLLYLHFCVSVTKLSFFEKAHAQYYVIVSYHKLNSATYQKERSY